MNPIQLSPEQWETVETLFEAITQVAANQQSEWLDSNCTDPVIHDAIQRLLQADEKARTSGDFEIPPVDAMGDWLEQDEPESRIPRQIGPYSLREELGRGATSIVFLATRENVGGRLALKLLRRDPIVAPEARQRFEFEHRVLAQLEHDNVARLLDAGVTPEGVPYLAMEYVEGLPITRFCRDNELDFEQRLGLFLQVCTAVSYAHSRGVIHRDLKPGNVFVNRDGEAKLLDFGIAKFIDEQDLEMPQTRTGMRLMTPEYAAPEQLRGEPATTASDIYALGVILYEMLAGRRPFVSETSRQDLERTVLTQIAANPSSVCSRSERRKLHGDLDAIIMKALRKAPGNRYRSVDRLAEDIELHRNGHAVSVRGGHRLYRARKFIQRNRLPAFITVVGIMLATTWFLRERELRSVAEDALTASRLEAQRNKAVAEFMVTLVARGDPMAADIDQWRRVTIREALDVAVQRLQTELQDQPMVRASLLREIAQAYLNMERTDESLALGQEALELYRSGSGQALEEARTLKLLASAHNWLKQEETALAYLRQSLAIQQSQLPANDPLYLESLELMAEIHAGLMNFEEAEDYLDQLINHYELDSSADPARLGDVYYSLGFLRMVEGRFSDAIPFHERSLELRLQQFPPRHPAPLESKRHIAISLYRLHDYEAALPLFLELHETAEALASAGGSQTDVGVNEKYIGEMVFRQGEIEDALARLARARNIIEKQVGPAHPWAATTRAALALVSASEGAYEQAVETITADLAPLHRQGKLHYWLEAVELLAEIHRNAGREKEELATYAYWYQLHHDAPDRLSDVRQRMTIRFAQLATGSEACPQVSNEVDVAAEAAEMHREIESTLLACANRFEPALPETP